MTDAPDEQPDPIDQPNDQPNEQAGTGGGHYVVARGPDLHGSSGLLDELVNAVSAEAAGHWNRNAWRYGPVRL